MPEDESRHPPNDVDLRARVLASPEEGWKTFWEIHGGFLHRLVERLGLSIDDKEEVRQEICHALIKDDFKVLRTWDPERCSLRGFLSVIVAHTVTNFYRSGFHRFTLRRTGQSVGTDTNEELYTNLMEATFSVEERLYQAQVTGFLRKSLDEWVNEEKLSPTDRSLVLLRLRGLSFKEISTLIGITTSHATVRFLRLKPLLRKKLEQAGIRPEG